MSRERTFDVILWGASGFTGRLVAEYLYQKYGDTGAVKWAMAGRNQEKLEKVRAAVASTTIPIITADISNEDSLKQMVQQTRVICTTVGPYAKYGSALVASCVAEQTDYCDLTGEVQWMRQMIDKHHETAQRNGTKIVHTCGFDSIPSDLGVYFIQRESQSKYGQYAKQVKMRVGGFKGGVSGGTYASLSNVMAEAREDKEKYRTLVNPYGLNPRGEESGPDQRDLQSIVYDDTSSSWLYPFVMAGINTKVVRRSNALAGYPYGKDFRYEEAMMAGSGFSGRVKAIMAAIPLGLMMSAKPGSLLKQFFDRLLPKPGEGPDKATREAGYYNFKFFVTLEDGTEVLAKVTGDRDPGYGSTCKMLAEAAICLAKDDLPATGGVLTPAVAMGDALLKRLEENAGLSFNYD